MVAARGGELLGPLGAELERLPQHGIEQVATARDRRRVELDVDGVPAVEFLGIAQDGVDALGLDGAEHLSDGGDHRRILLGGRARRPGAFKSRYRPSRGPRQEAVNCMRRTVYACVFPGQPLVFHPFL